MRTFVQQTKVVLFTVIAIGLPSACGDDDDGGDPVCDYDGVCDVADGETRLGCPEDCPVCNHDATCDSSLGEDETNCPDDCATQCDPTTVTGPMHDFVASLIFIPTTSQEAGENGIDLDGDGDIDNKLYQVIQMLRRIAVDGDANEHLNEDIAAGKLLLLGRLQESGLGDGVISLRTMQGTVTTGPPLFDGTDNLQIAPTSPTELVTCGSWTQTVFTTRESQLFLPVPLVFSAESTQEYVYYGAHNARLETVTNPESQFSQYSEVTASAWTDVMVGGGLTTDQAYNELLPDLQARLATVMTGGGIRAENIAALFDGKCEELLDVPGCVWEVPGQGECDDTAVPPVITLTELQCSAWMHSALAPDVDSDGDGEADLISFGYRIVAAVPATLY